MTLKFSNPNRPRTVNPPVVYRSDSWPVGGGFGDFLTEPAWGEWQHVYLDNMSWATPPSVSTAELSYIYGRGFRPGDTAWDTIPPIWAMDRNREFVRIETGLPAVASITDPADEEEIIAALGLPPGTSDPDAITALEEALGVEPAGDLVAPLAESKIPRRWFGSIEVFADHPGGKANGIARGQHRIMCYGLEFSLQKMPILQSHWLYTTTPFLAESGAVFNGPRQGRAASKEGGEDFYRFQDPEHGATSWSTADAVEYLIRGIAYERSDALEFVIDDADLAKLDDQDRPVLDTDGATLWQLLGSLINRQRLMMWWVEVDEDSGSPTYGLPKIRIETMSQAGLMLPTGHTIPAAATQYDLDFTTSTHTTTVYQQDSTQVVDQVICRGARRRYVRSDELGDAGSPFTGSWAASQVTDYETGQESMPDFPAAAEINPRRQFTKDWRGQEKYDHVFSHFILDEQITADGYACPPRIKLLNELPMFRGSNYNQDPCDHVTAATSLTQPELWPIYCIAKIPSTADKYAFSDKLGVGIFPWQSEEDAAEFSVRVSVRPEEHVLRLQVFGAPQHAIAYGDFTPTSYDETANGEWDYNQFHVTYAFETDQRAEGVWPDPDAGAGDDLRQIVIEMGDRYRVDHLADQTVLGIDDDRELVIKSGDGFLQDDRPILEAWARLAWDWYSELRRALRVDTTYDWPAGILRRGDFVTTFANAEAQAVNASVTEIAIHYPSYVVTDNASLELPPPKLSFQTAFGELDLLAL